MNPITKACIIGTAGFAGAIARFAVHSLFAKLGLTFPLGTLVINAVGSFALGCLLGADVGRGIPEYVRLLVGVGFLGAFTTFSTFSVETDLLVRDARWTVALAYVALSVLLGVLGARMGYVLCR